MKSRPSEKGDRDGEKRIEVAGLLMRSGFFHDIQQGGQTMEHNTCRFER